MYYFVHIKLGYTAACTEYMYCKTYCSKRAKSRQCPTPRRAAGPLLTGSVSATTGGVGRRPLLLASDDPAEDRVKWTNQAIGFRRRLGLHCTRRCSGNERMNRAIDSCWPLEMHAAWRRRRTVVDNLDLAGHSAIFAVFYYA